VVNGHLDYKTILFVTRMIHAQTVQYIEMPFAPYDRAMLDARFPCGS